MIFTDDPIADFERHDAEQQAELDKLPICEYCEDPIQDDYYFVIGNECICEDCLNDNFRKDVEYD
jgi:hypothetical protein